MKYVVEINYEVEIEADSEDEADLIARHWDLDHPQTNRQIKPEYVVVCPLPDCSHVQATRA